MTFNHDMKRLNKKQVKHESILYNEKKNKHENKYDVLIKDIYIRNKIN